MKLPKNPKTRTVDLRALATEERKVGAMVRFANGRWYYVESIGKETACLVWVEKWEARFHQARDAT